MRTLENALVDHELITLRVIGEWWELDLTGADKTACVKALAQTLQELDLSLELSYLPPEDGAALRDLVAAGGKMPVGTFSRQHGEVRQMGPAKMEREEPWFEPVSPAEALWYRGLLYRNFDEAEAGEFVEYYYLPQELYETFPEVEKAEAVMVKERPLAPAEPPETFDAATASAVDDLTTCLAFAQREGLARGALPSLSPYLYNSLVDRTLLLVTVAEEKGLLREGNGSFKPARPAIGWLKQEREAQLRALADAWSSSSWNDLCHTPGLQCEGSGWTNDPIAARTALLDALPRDQAWYGIEALGTYVKEIDPDFQRPEGNYDTWYIRDEGSNAYIKGFENWEMVEGRLLRFLLEGPMHWLGLTDVGEGKYRLTERAIAWLADEAPNGAGVQVPLVVQPDAGILVPHNASRYQRFQVARIADAEPLQPGQPYLYRLSPRSLAQGRAEGIEPERVLQFLQEASGRPLPASVRRAVERWAEHGLEGRLQPAIILRVRNAEILDKLQDNSRTRSLIGERLGDLAAVVRGDRWQELQQVTAELGLLLDIEEDEQ